MKVWHTQFHVSVAQTGPWWAGAEGLVPFFKKKKTCKQNSYFNENEDVYNLNPITSTGLLIFNARLNSFTNQKMLAF